PLRRPGVGHPAGRPLGVRVLDPRLRALPDSGSAGHRTARPDVPAGGVALRVDPEGVGAVLGVLRRILRLVARRPRDGRHGRPGGDDLAVHRPGWAPEDVGADARHPGRALVFGVHVYASLAHHAVVREPGRLLL